MAGLAKRNRQHRDMHKAKKPRYNKRRKPESKECFIQDGTPGFQLNKYVVVTAVMNSGARISFISRGEVLDPSLLCLTLEEEGSSPFDQKLLSLLNANN
jgi:hypothetical protein